jgi:hypothetical protein
MEKADSFKADRTFEVELLGGPMDGKTFAVSEIRAYLVLAEQPEINWDNIISSRDAVNVTIPQYKNTQYRLLDNWRDSTGRLIKINRQGDVFIDGILSDSPNVILYYTFDREY